MATTGLVNGHCEDGYGRLADLLARRLRDGREIGASIGVYRHGRPVVAIWGGHRDRQRTTPWAADTITPIASISKALATSVALELVERGLLDLERAVADHWPGFAQRGKGEVNVALVLSHRSGLAALDAPISNDEAAALDPVLERIERQRLWWPPGTRHGYHAMTFGFIVSGLVRAVTGQTVGEYFADRIATPWGLDLHLGLPHEEHHRVAPMIGPTGRAAIRSLIDPLWLPHSAQLLRRGSVAYRATFGGTSVGFDDAAELTRYDVEDASAGGLGNGPALARLFAALIGEVEGRRLIGPALMNRARVTQASGRDEVLRMRSDWGLGFALPGGPLFPDMGGPGLFGHTGASGSLAFADPDHDLAFGYTPNHWGELSGRGRTRFRSTEYAEEAFAGAGIRRWPVR